MKKSITTLLLIFVLSGCAEDTADTAFVVDQQPNCELLPKFTIGVKSNPSQDQIGDLCLCIMGSLSGESMATAVVLSRDQEIDLEVNGFVSEFGATIQSFGAGEI